MFEISYDAGARRLSLRLTEFWTPDTMTRFEAELGGRLDALHRRDEAFDVLSDAGGFPVQSPEVAGRFAQMMARFGAVRARRVAIVVASTLNKMQAGRALGGERIRMFLDAGEAQAWLAQP